MACSRVLSIVFLAVLVASDVLGLSVISDKDFNYCTAPQVTWKGRKYDVFCVGVKNKTLSFPEGTGCLKDNNCEVLIVARSSTAKNEVRWFLEAKTNLLTTFLILNHERPSKSELGKKYKLPKNLFAVGRGRVAFTDKHGKENVVNPGPQCLDGTTEVVTRHAIDCPQFKADLYNDALYATLLILNENLKVVAEYHLPSAIKLFGRKDTSGGEEGLSGGEIACIAIGAVVGFFFLVALIAGIVYYAIKTDPAANVESGVEPNPEPEVKPGAGPEMQFEASPEAEPGMEFEGKPEMEPAVDDQADKSNDD